MVGPAGVMVATGGVHGVAHPEARATDPLDQVVLGITSASSSAYSQLPGVAKSHWRLCVPAARILKRTLNMSPLKATGVRLNQAARNWEAPLKTPQLDRNPAEMLEFSDVTEEIH